MVSQAEHRRRLTALKAAFDRREITARQFQDRAVQYDREFQATSSDSKASNS